MLLKFKQFLKRLFHIHSWTKWETIGEGPIVHSTHRQPIGYWIRQKRKCTECNLVCIVEDEA